MGGLELDGIVGSVHEGFNESRTILSFRQYYELLRLNPNQHMRSSSRYVVDMIESFGREKQATPIGAQHHYGLFDAPFRGGEGRVIGQERVLEEIHRLLGHFSRQGRTNKLILLHGPNGSAKSSIVRCMMAGLEAYAMQPEGAVYSFNWIFPSERLSGERIGFGQPGGERVSDEDSYAHVPADEIIARIPCELKDHPLFLVPADLRSELLNELLPDGEGGTTAPEYLRRGDLSHKNRQIYDALLASYDGDLNKVLRHIQVERVYLSRRYRRGAVTVEPQMSVDATLRQITADRTMAQLPVALQHLSLYTPSGPLVDANRGLLEFSDLLKRPVEAFKYLLGTVETNTVAMDSFLLHLDMVFIGSTNETYLDAFKQHPDFPSFKGRMELVQVPYLLRYKQERKVYDMQITERVVGRHVAPHATSVAAMWSVLSRLRRNDPSKYPDEIGEVVDSLTPIEKLWLYQDGVLPKRLTTREKKELKHYLPEVANEGQTYTNYEGRFGASAREMYTALMNAAHRPDYTSLHPLAVFDEVRNILRAKSVHAFLKQEPVKGFHDHASFLQHAEEAYGNVVEQEVRTASGLAEEQSHGELFERYVNHVTHWVKGSRMEDPSTGQLRDPDENLMKKVEEVLVEGDEEAADFRRSLIATIGAKSLDAPGAKPDYMKIFADFVDRIKEDFYAEHRSALRKRMEDLLRLTNEDEVGELNDEEKLEARQMLDRMATSFGYNDESARDTVSYLLKIRYGDL